MPTTCEDVKSRIVEWMRQEVECEPRGPDLFILTLPILKPNGDSIELSVENMNRQGWRISDLGDTHATLFLGGVDVTDNDELARAEEFRQIKAAYRIMESDEELSVQAGEGDLAEAVFELSHAIQSVLSLQLTVVPTLPKREFAVLVAQLLAENRASFNIPTGPIEGKTGGWKFDFILNHNEPEILVKTLTAPSRSKALHSSKEAVFDILDVRALRDSGAVVVVDDEGQRQSFWRPNIIRVFEENNIPVHAFHKDREALIRLALSHAPGGVTGT